MPKNPYEPPSYNEPFKPGPRDPFATQTAPRARKQGNPQGVAGFVLALVSLVPCCGLPIAPAGLIVSVMGLSREPRGLAVAGVAVSIVALLMNALFAGIAYFTFATYGRGNVSHGFELILEQAMIEVEIQERGSMPATLDELSLPADQITDPWGNPYEYTVYPDGGDYKLFSVGPDGKAETSDDVQLHPQ